MTRGDALVVVVVAVLALLAWPATYIAAGGPSDSAIITGPEGRTVVSMKTDRALDIQGLAGVLHVRVQNGAVRVTAASCRDKICIHQGAVSSPGRAIVCAPNGVSIRVGGGGGDGLDYVVR